MVIFAASITSTEAANSTTKHGSRKSEARDRFGVLGVKP
jgi:hypothetical protein